MNSNGDFPRFYAGLGQQTAPSFTFGMEPVTGTYIEPSGSTSEMTVVKKGVKRVRYLDDQTIFEGKVVAPGIVPVIPSPLTIEVGTSSNPSLNFTGHTDSGLSSSTSGEVYIDVKGSSGLVVGPTIAVFSKPTYAPTFQLPTDSVLSTPRLLFGSNNGLSYVSSGTSSALIASVNGSGVLAMSPTLTEVSTKLQCDQDLDVAGYVKSSSVNDQKVLVGNSSKQIASSLFSISDVSKNYVYFGDGSDGAVTISNGSTTTLTRDMYYTTLTLNNNSQINTGGYRIFASVAITGDGTGIIQFNGASGVGQAALPSINNNNALSALTASVAGGAINTSPTGSGSLTSSPFTAAGRGADSDTKTGAAGTTVARSNFYMMRNIPLITTVTTSFGFCGAGGAGAGGSLHVGGTGGQGAGLVFISALAIGNVLLQAIGGRGAPAGGATGGVGGGGSGGVVVVNYQSFLNSWNPATSINVSAGAIGPAPGLTTNATPGNNGAYQLNYIA